MLEPTDEEAGTGQLVGLVQVAEPWPAAVVVACFSACLSFLVVPCWFLRPSPIHHTAAVKILHAAAAGIGVGGGGSPACLTVLSLFARCWLNQDVPACPWASKDVLIARVIWSRSRLSSALRSLVIWEII